MAKLYLAVPQSYRKLLPVEGYCQAAGVSPYRVLELITGLVVRFGAQALGPIHDKLEFAVVGLDQKR